MCQEKKVAVITGSSKGIGRAIAEQLALQGKIVIVTSRNKEQAQATAETIKKNGGEALGIKFNLEESYDFDSLISETISTFGRLDILVNNAVSKNSLVPLLESSADQIELACTTNISNTILLSKLSHPYLKKSKGSIINITSIITNRHLLGLSLYSIIKGAILQMTKALAAEWAHDGIRVNAISPGFIRTNAFEDMGMAKDEIERSYDFYKQYHPLGRIGEPIDVGKVAAYLSSDDADLITGAVIEIDGGYAIQGLSLYRES